MEVFFEYDAIPLLATAMKAAAPQHLLRAMGKALFRIGKSDTELMRGPGLADLNVKSRGFRNSFKFKATDSRQSKSVDELVLSEYTGAKPFGIFQTGGDIEPRKSHLLTILTDAARGAGGRRKFTQKELQAMIASGEAKIIQTKAGPAVIRDDQKTTKTGKARKGSKVTILAWLKPQVSEGKRIDFYANFEANEAAHNALLSEAALEAIEKTIADKGSGG